MADGSQQQAAPTDGERASSEHISLRVVSQDGNEVHFKIKKNTPLRKLMDAYTERQGVQPHSVRFLFDGQRITPEQTPKDLDMEDGDTIGENPAVFLQIMDIVSHLHLDAVLMQTGGTFWQ